MMVVGAPSPTWQHCDVTEMVSGWLTMPSADARIDAVPAPIALIVAELPLAAVGVTGNYLSVSRAPGHGAVGKHGAISSQRGWPGGHCIAGVHFQRARGAERNGRDGQPHHWIIARRVLQRAAFERLPVIAVGQDDLVGCRQTQISGGAALSLVQIVNRTQYREDLRVIGARSDLVDRAAGITSARWRSPWSRKSRQPRRR